MAVQNKYEIISLADFEARIKCGNRYHGLVDGVGYVYWISRPIYFININQDNFFLLPIYKQISNPWFGFDRSKKVHTKTLYTLCVLSREELMKQDINMYLFYYGHIIKMEKAIQVMPPDAIRVEKPIICVDIQRKQSYEKSSSAGRQAWKVFDGATDVADDFGFIHKPINKYLSIGKTAINVIDNVNNGQYLDAAGNILLSFVDCNIGVYIDIGTALYKTDLMQRRLATDYAKEYKRLEKQYIIEKKRRSPNYGKIRILEKQMNETLNKFKKCMDNLGYKY